MSLSPQKDPFQCSPVQQPRHSHTAFATHILKPTTAPLLASPALAAPALASTYGGLPRAQEKHIHRIPHYLAHT